MTRGWRWDGDAECGGGVWRKEDWDRDSGSLGVWRLVFWEAAMFEYAIFLL